VLLCVVKFLCCALSSAATPAKNQEKPGKIGNFSEKPKKTVEIGRFLIDFAHAKAAW
jgi:hypothetical protein